MGKIIEAFGFGALPTAIIAALCAALLFLLKREFRLFNGKIDGMDKKISQISLDLEKNNALTERCAETSRLLLLGKMRFFVEQNGRSRDKDAYFQSLYRRFEQLGNGDDWGLLEAWQKKPLES